MIASPPSPSWLARQVEELGAAAHRAFAALPSVLSLRPLRSALRWASGHTGLPVVVVGALALVLAFRVARRTATVFVELTLALAVLVLASRLGWIRW